MCLKNHQMRIQLTSFSKTCARHDISDRSAAALAAALASAVLHDVGIVTPEKSKVRRERQKNHSTPKEVKEKILNLNHKKSPGSGNIKNETLKTISSPLS